MALNRSRRANAGSKMATLLDSEEVDDVSGLYRQSLPFYSMKTLVRVQLKPFFWALQFYSTTYGGFAEEAEDREFAYQSPVEDDDAVDSDFSIDENDEPRSDLEDEAKAGGERPRLKRGQGVQTKAYKEPKRDAQGKKVDGKATKKDSKKTTKTTSPDKKKVVSAVGRSTTPAAAVALHHEV